MTEITHEALEALNQRSLEAQQTYRACSGLSDLATMIDAHNAFGSALIDLYRTGQLVLAQPSGDATAAAFEVGQQTYERIGVTPAMREVMDLCKSNRAATAQPSGDEVEAVADAIERAECPGREGPFGGYDYGQNEAFYGKAPDGGRYVIRDFRDPASPDWGKWLHQTENRDEHDAMFQKMTREHIATGAITALDAHRGKQ